MAQFKAEAGKIYKNPTTGMQVSYTAEQLKDPAQGMLSSDFQEYNANQGTLPPTGATQSPSVRQDVSGAGATVVQPSPAKEVNVITSQQAQGRIDSLPPPSADEQRMSAIEYEYAQQREKAKKRLDEEAALKMSLQGVKAAEATNEFLEGQKSQRAADFKLGRSGTYYQENALDRAKQDFDRQQYRFQIEDQLISNQIRDAWENNDSRLARELEQKKQAITTQRKQEAREAEDKFFRRMELSSKLEDRADKAFEKLAQSGVEVDDEDLSFIEERYGLDSGMGRVIYEAHKTEARREQIKDEREARKFDFDVANSITTMLSKVPVGQSVIIGGQEYMGLDRGDIKTGTETNSQTGEVTFWEYNPMTGRTKTTSLGQIGTTREGWETRFDDNGQPWRLNPTTGQFLPFYPTRAQQDIQTILPEGSISPFVDKNGKPRTECGAFVNDCTDLGVGDSYESKMTKMNLWKKGDKTAVESIVDKIQVGDVFTQKLNTWTGHVGMVLGVEKGPNGVMGIRAFESNYVPGKVTSTRFIPLSEVDGFGRGPTLHPLLKSGPDSQRNFASPTQAVGEPGVAPTQIPTTPTFGGKKEEKKVLSINELKEVNSGLPEGKKLSPGATLEDAAKAGYTPGARPKEPLKLDDKQRQLISKSEEKKALDAGRDLADSLKAYRDLVSQKGFEAFGAGRTQLERAYADLKIKYKEAANLGALTGPDVAIIEEAIKPATGFSGVWAKITSGGNEGILAGVDDAARALQRGMLRKYDTLTSQYDDYSSDPYLKSLGKGITIRVKDISTGKTGTLPAEEFDPSKFERL